MNTNVRYNTSKTNHDKARRKFLDTHTGTPSALLGGCMEREAYLDSLVPEVLKASSMPKSRR